MGKYVKKTLKEKVQLIEESKLSGILETARKHNLHYQTLKNWVDAYAIHGKDGLERRVEKINPELKRLYLENEQLKLILAEKELELRIKNDLLKKTLYQTSLKK
jgi:putative transposase